MRKFKNARPKNTKSLAEVKKEFSARKLGTYDDLLALMGTWFDIDDEQLWAQRMKKSLCAAGRRLAEKHEDITIVALGESNDHALGLTFNHKTEDEDNVKLDIVFEIEMNAVVLLKA